jgi:hypothetical protein
MLPPFGHIEGISGFSRFSANESLKRTGLYLSFSAKSSFTSLHLRSPVHVESPLIENGGWFKLAFAERDKKQTVIDLRGISSNWYIKPVLSLHKAFHRLYTDSELKFRERLH